MISSNKSKTYLSLIEKLNKELNIPADYEKRGMTFYFENEKNVIGDTDPNNVPMLMESMTADYWNKMKRNAAEDGISLLVEYSFRSIEQQADLIRKELKLGKSIEETLTWIAAPGYSEHHTGKAIDIASPDCFPTPITDEFEKTIAFQWLRSNANRFGFFLTYPRNNLHGIIYEPWHWCFNEGRV